MNMMVHRLRESQNPTFFFKSVDLNHTVQFCNKPQRERERVTLQLEMAWSKASMRAESSQRSPSFPIIKRECSVAAATPTNSLHTRSIAHVLRIRCCLQGNWRFVLVKKGEKFKILPKLYAQHLIESQTFKKINFTAKVIFRYSFSPSISIFQMTNGTC